MRKGREAEKGKAGMPKKFPLKQISATGDVQGGRQRAPHLTDGKIVPYLRVANVFDGYIDFSDVNVMPFRPEEIEKFRLLDGDILLNEGQSSELVGRCAMYTSGPDDCCYQNTLIRYRARPDTNPHFALQLFRYCQSSGIFSRISVKTNSIAHLGVSRFADLELPFPPLAMQVKIADILATWDNTLSASSRLLLNKEKIFYSLREVLTAGHGKKTTANQWPTIKLGDVTQHLTTRNSNRLGRDSVMGVTKAEGVVPMREHVMAADLSRYVVLPPEAFAYNPMRINIGSIAMSEAEEDVLVSPDYVVFACDPAKLLPRYLNHLRKTARWARFMDIAGNGSVRIRIYYADLADFEFHLPPLAEQARVVAILDDAEREIALLHAERRAREAQRNALATKLLTGEWRVAV